MFKYITSIVVLVVFLSSCDTVEQTGEPVVPFTKPNMGSFYTFAFYSNDTTTGKPIEESRDTSVMTVTQTGMTFQGKSNVIEVVESGGASGGTVYYSFEGNNDFSIYHILYGWK